MKKLTLALLIFIFATSCKKQLEKPLEYKVEENPLSYAEIASLNLGGLGAAEITTYDPISKRLFAVNNGTTNRIDVIDMANPASISLIASINLTTYGGYVNSVDVSNGKLAAAIESVNKQDNGKIVVFNTTTYAEEKVITVGALPDMVVYSPDGKFIVTANEGEPNDSYTNDPDGSISIISVNENYAVTTLNFAEFEASKASLIAKGMRISGLNKNFLKDIEPEYISISKDSKLAWITLQEANAIATLDLISKKITRILPLGFKDYSSALNPIDISDKDATISFANWNVFGTYMPDAIANMEFEGNTYLFTANEGDSREYSSFVDFKRVNSLTLDPVAFPTAATLKADAKMGRLNVLTTNGDTDGDGDYDALYSLGARSFSIWNATSGNLVYDSRNELDIKAKELGVYDDARSDDKSVEPEAVTIGRVGYRTLAFVGLERADAFAIYDVTYPTSPIYLTIIKTGDAPEGLLFIPASKSPIQQSLVVVSSENDGNLKIYKAQKL